MPEVTIKVEQIGRTQAVWRASAPQRGQHVELPDVQIESGEAQFEMLFQQGGTSLDATDWPHRTGVQIGPLLRPLVKDGVHRIGWALAGFFHMAVRSASLAAMTLMLAAQGLGLGSCAMSGFDAQQVSRAFDLDATELPVMIVTVGYAADDNWPQKPRKALTEVFSIV